jgi:hypothetical protein
MKINKSNSLVIPGFDLEQVSVCLTFNTSHEAMTLGLTHRLLEMVEPSSSGRAHPFDFCEWPLTFT